MADPIDSLPWKKPHATHWQLPELKLDYWPTRFKWRHQGVTRVGHNHLAVLQYIASLNDKGRAPDMPMDEDKIGRKAWWGYTEISGRMSVYIMGNPNDPKERADTIKALRLALYEYETYPH